MTRDQFIAYLKEQVKQYGSQKVFADYCRVSPAFLSDVIRGRRDPGHTLLQALGFDRVVTYERKPHGE